MVKEIQLTQGKVALVDDDNYEWLMRGRKWGAYKSGYTYYAQRGVVVDGRKTVEQMHRLILSAPKGTLVDHEDRNGLNNQRRNIRLVSFSGNRANSRLNSNNTSGYRGVCWSKKLKNWGAYIKYKQTETCLGSFKTKEEAAKAYDKAASMLFGDLASLNVS